METGGTPLAKPKHEFGHDRSNRFIRARYLFLFFILAIVLSVGILFLIWPTSAIAGFSPITKSALFVIFNVALFATLFLPARRAKIGVAELMPVVSLTELRWIIGTACALVAVSYATVYILYFPLSYVTPDLVTSRLLDPRRSLLWLDGDHYQLANILSLVAVIALAPVVEEFFFRGLLLRTWLAKWGARPAIIVSSLIFGALHADILGGFVVSIVLSLSYMWTGRLAVPIMIHMTINLLGMLVMGGDLILVEPHSHSIAEFQSQWWIGVLGFVIGVPALIWILQNSRPAAVTPI